MECKYESLEESTICSNIHTLYILARFSKREEDVRILKAVFMKAKKMNKQLHKNKYGTLLDFPNNSWKEEDWEKELESGVHPIQSSEELDIIVKARRKEEVK